MTKLEKVKSIARKVRRAFEEIEKEENYNEADDFGFDLGGYCGRAAIQLFIACKKEGIEINIEEGIGHAYNKFNNYIIDITATQFGKYPRVYIKKYKGRKPEHYQKVRMHTTKSLADEFWISPHIITKDKKVVNFYQ